MTIVIPQGLLSQVLDEVKGVVNLRHLPLQCLKLTFTFLVMELRDTRYTAYHCTCSHPVRTKGTERLRTACNTSKDRTRITECIGSTLVAKSIEHIGQHIRSIGKVLENLRHLFCPLLHLVKALISFLPFLCIIFVAIRPCAVCPISIIAKQSLHTSLEERADTTPHAKESVGLEL